jgi:hypothetical protein
MSESVGESRGIFVGGDSTDSIEKYLSSLRTGKHNESDENPYNIYGRVERVVINEMGEKEVPEMLTYRPRMREGVDPVHFSFVLGSEAMTSIIEKQSMEEVLSGVISLDKESVATRLSRIAEGKLDNMIIVFSPSLQVPTKLADINGLIELVENIHPDAAKRLASVSDRFRQECVGDTEDKFLHRQRLLPPEEWLRLKVVKDCLYQGLHEDKEYPSCGCKRYSFDDYCIAFDLAMSTNGYDEAYLETRRMMYTLLHCNEFYGFDGFTYRHDGVKLDKEYMSVNRRIDNGQFFTCFFSEIERFRVP